MDRRAVRRVQRAEVRRAADARPRLVGFEHPVVVFAEPETTVVRELLVEALEVRGQRRDVEVPAARPVAVDALRLR